MNLRDRLAWLHPLFAAVLPLAIGLVGCGTDSLVGGGCREGLSECSLKCVDLDQDPKNCGACGKSCQADLICFKGSCVNEGDVFPFGRDGGDASRLRDGASDVSAGDGTTGDQRLSDGPGNDGPGNDDPGNDGSGSDGSGSDGPRGDGNVCVPPFDNASHCGDCNTQCSGATPVCGLEGTYKCLAACEAPLEACGPACVDKFSDENNCGVCGKICPSAICQAGKCVGAGFGHEIIIGMDYFDPLITQGSAQVTMLGNAVLLVNKPTIEVLAYDQFSEPSNVTQIQGWLKTAANSRTINFTNIKDWMSVPAMLAVTNFQVFLVYDQPKAPVDQMATSGTLWNGAMDAFAKGGGVVVVLEGGTGHNADLLTNGGLLPVTSESSVAGTQVRVDAPTDVVGLFLPSVFAARKNSVAFTTTQVADSHHVFVVKDAAGVLPVVVHAVP